MTTTILPNAVKRFLDQEHGSWINGAAHRSSMGASFVTEDPATGAPLARVIGAGEADVEQAVESAQRALEGSWAAASADRRGTLLWALADLVDRHRETLAQVEALDGGKPIANVRADDLPMVVRVLRYYAGWATKLNGAVMAIEGAESHVYTRREPVGVCAGIVPWNYPLSLAAWKLGPALACGNTMVLKPAEQTPLATLLLAELATEAGLPPGVLNVVTGGPAVGRALVGHPRVRQVAFTGSTEVGREIGAQTGRDLKHASLELGGKSANIIFADAPRSRRQGALWGIFYNMGQDCSAGSRLLVQDTIYDEVVEQLVTDAGKLVVGHPLDTATQVGPLVSARQRDRVLAYVDGAVRDGAYVACGGSAAPEAGDGFYVAPTVLVNVPVHSAAAREEIFGPVVVVSRFADEAEAIQRANASAYGLAAGVWTSDVGRAHRVAARLDAGTVWINTYGVVDAAVPFGGRHDSGLGRELGEEALRHYTDTKSVWLDISTPD